MDGKRERLQNLVGEMETRVEYLRRQAISLKEEKESILELLQDVQDGSSNTILSEDDLEDFEYNVERLILRCLTVEVSVATPRNETQENAYLRVSDIVEDLQKKLKLNPGSQRTEVESHLNACLPDPLSSNVNYRFQEKLLDCTAEDQKYFRKQLQGMFYSAPGKGVKMRQGIWEDTRNSEAGTVAAGGGTMAAGGEKEEGDDKEGENYTLASDSLENGASGGGRIVNGER